jgi:RHH-type proline utilization regulon transcriptional repressor/proline dehydrogenase/delta 1-pyrroline-5-carboxylate dehydrogenase
VHDDVYFREQLRDAAESLAVGSAWDPASVVTPLIRPPGPALLRGLTDLDPGESWLLAPRCHPDNPCLWSPGIKVGVEPGSFSHQTELFGPVLSLLRADDLEHAIDIANATPYGLTAGLHSLDEREQARFIERMQAGNLYVNRTTVGAIVGRQPFGGHKASSVGPGAKAGGPNYVLELQEISDADSEREDSPFGEPASLPPEVRAVLEWSAERLEARDVARVRARVHDYHGWRDRYFDTAHSTTPVLGQDNVLIYRSAGAVLLVAGEGSSPVDVVSALSAALLSGCEVQMSLNPSGVGSLAAREFVLLGQAARVPTHIEAANVIASRLDRDAARYPRIRWLFTGEAPPDALLRAAADRGAHISSRPVLAHGRYELLHYHREQTISIDFHRYGHLGFRSEGLGDLASGGVLQSSGLKINSSATFSPSGPAERGP